MEGKSLEWKSSLLKCDKVGLCGVCPEKNGNTLAGTEEESNKAKGWEIGKGEQT
jgi:hypothetical protein